MIATIVALGGGALSMLSLSAALIAGPSSATLERLRRGEDVDREAKLEAAERALRAGRLFQAGRYNSDALLALGALDHSSRQRIVAPQTVGDLIDETLIAAPASPHNWVRRAQLQLLAGDIDGARGSLETSMLMGRFVPGLTVPRLRVLLALLGRSADHSLERSFGEQVRIAARTEPHDLAAFADRGGADGRVQAILGADFTLYAPYLKALMALRAEKARDAGRT